MATELREKQSNNSREAVYLSRNLIVVQHEPESGQYAAQIAKRVGEVLAAALDDVKTEKKAGRDPSRSLRLACVAQRTEIVWLPPNEQFEWAQRYDYATREWVNGGGLLRAVDNVLAGGVREDLEREAGIYVRQQALTLHYLMPLLPPTDIAEALQRLSKAAPQIEARSALGRIYRVGWLLPPSDLNYLRVAENGQADAYSLPQDMAAARLFEAGWEQRETQIMERAANTQRELENLDRVGQVWMLLRETSGAGARVPRGQDNRTLHEYAAAALLAMLTASLYGVEPDFIRRLFMVGNWRFRPPIERIVPISLRRAVHPYGALRKRLEKRLAARLIHHGLFASKLSERNGAYEIDNNKSWRIKAPPQHASTRYGVASKGEDEEYSLDYLSWSERQELLNGETRAAIKRALRASSRGLKMKLMLLWDVEAAITAAANGLNLPTDGADALADAFPNQAVEEEAEAGGVTLGPLTTREKEEQAELDARLNSMAERARVALEACSPKTIAALGETKRAPAMDAAGARLRSILEGIDPDTPQPQVGARNAASGSPALAQVADISSIREAVQEAIRQARRDLNRSLLARTNYTLGYYAGSAPYVAVELANVANSWRGWWREVHGDDAPAPAQRPNPLIDQADVGGMPRGAPWNMPEVAWGAPGGPGAQGGIDPERARTGLPRYPWQWQPPGEEVRREVAGRSVYRPALVLWTLILAVFLGQLGSAFSLHLPGGLLQEWHMGFMAGEGWERVLPGI
ncbi:MAG TPA: hypothetical protein VEX13_11235, partial [Chloroflexia bacterium]|nr:hypothetical protein [Chloroflexia bacterium]